MVGHAVIVRGRYCALIKRRKHYERFDISLRPDESSQWQRRKDLKKYGDSCFKYFIAG